jgi:hypothetical protein
MLIVHGQKVTGYEQHEVLGKTLSILYGPWTRERGTKLIELDQDHGYPRVRSARLVYLVLSKSKRSSHLLHKGPGQNSRRIFSGLFKTAVSSFHLREIASFTALSMPSSPVCSHCTRPLNQPSYSCLKSNKRLLMAVACRLPMGDPYT